MNYKLKVAMSLAGGGRGWIFTNNNNKRKDKSRAK
jgi:hypothetical protein